MADVLIIETGNGGDLLLRGNDLAMVSGAENMPYLAMFAAINDWWANSLLLGESIDIQFSSKSENALNAIQLNSSGRVALQNAILNDLKSIKTSSNSAIVVNVFFVDADKIEIQISIEGQLITMYWQPDESFLTYKI